jgi:hypothetical protein
VYLLCLVYLLLECGDGRGWTFGCGTFGRLGHFLASAPLLPGDTAVIIRKISRIFIFVGESRWILTLSSCTSRLEGSEDPLAPKLDSVVKVRNRLEW